MSFTSFLSDEHPIYPLLFIINSISKFKNLKVLHINCVRRQHSHSHLKAINVIFLTKVILHLIIELVFKICDQYGNLTFQGLCLTARYHNSGSVRITEITFHDEIMK